MRAHSLRVPVAASVGTRVRLISPPPVHPQGRVARCGRAFHWRVRTAGTLGPVHFDAQHLVDLARRMGVPATDAASQVFAILSARPDAGGIDESITRDAEGMGERHAQHVTVLDAMEVEHLRGWAAEVEGWPAGSHVWGHYAEATASGPAICRTENVSACHPGVAALVDGALRAVAADALGEPVVSFKDKINYKQPGGAGFRPHQDRVAYPGVNRVMSILVALDPCTTESGCLWLAGGVDEVLPTDDRGVVREDVARALDWDAVELAPGDAVLLDGLVPHYSDANTTPGARRVLVASYAPAAEKYTRQQYYAARRDVMTRSSEHDGRFRISTLADFAGAEVAPDTAAHEHCTHR
jgi:hypothetical protein